MPLPERKYHKRGEKIDGVLARAHPLYSTWAQMMQRCYKETCASFANYGGRGITVSERWWHFANFVADIGTKPTKHHTLERVNNDEGYSRLNCVWASRSEQCVNRRTFKNNSSGCTGVIPLRNGTYAARFDYEGVRYSVGRYQSLDEAVEARKMFVDLFKRDRVAAEKLASAEKLSLASSTGHRGINPHRDGGYTVRATVNGDRIYLGYFKTLEEAIDAKRRANQS